MATDPLAMTVPTSSLSTGERAALDAWNAAQALAWQRMDERNPLTFPWA